MLLFDLARTSGSVAETSSRLAKTEAIAETLRAAAPVEVPIAVAYLSGELPQRQIGVGWATLRDAPPPAADPSLTIAAVDAMLSAIKELAGPGSQSARRDLVAELFALATEREQRFLGGLLSGELRQGAQDGVMTEAIAKAAEVPVAEVRRAHMLRGSLAAVAAAALADGVAALRAFHLEVGRPLQPMLASSAPTMTDAFAKVSPAAVEWKLDGVRAQIHRDGSDVAVFTRTLDDITVRVPEVVEAALAWPVRDAVLDGELIALRQDGRPRPFQETASRTGSRSDVSRLRTEIPLSLFLFDALRLDGVDLLDEPGARRHEALAGAVPEVHRTPRIVTADEAEATAFYEDSVAHGHEGVVVKSLDAPYAAGRRGAGWIKVKPRHTLDLVVLAAEWGHGRRKGWLSNLHLGARDPDGGFVMLGKTFKGLTDELLTWQTKRLLELATSPADDWVVEVRPELVVEIAFDGLQRSSRYPGGLALRFARVLRYRPDKTPTQADTITTVRTLAAI